MTFGYTVPNNLVISELVINATRDPPQVLKKADDATLVLKAEKDGKIRITSIPAI